MTTPATSPSPSAAAFASTPSDPFNNSSPWCSRKTSVLMGCPVASYEALLGAEVEGRLSRVAVVLDFLGVAARRRIVQRIDLRARPLFTRALGLDAEIRECHGLLRLGLRAHDPF